jgi:hypothetical protein
MNTVHDQEREFVKGVFHEVNLHGALKDAVRGARGFYLLSIECPPTASVTPDTVLSIEIRSAPPLLVSAQAISAATAPILRIQVSK